MSTRSAQSLLAPSPNDRPLSLPPVISTSRRAELPQLSKPTCSMAPSLAAPPEPTETLMEQPHPFPDSILSWITSRLPASLVHFVSQNLGLAYVAFAQLFFVFMGLTVKYFLSVTGMSATTLIFVRMAITSVGCVVSLYAIKDPNPLLGPPEIRKMLVLRGFFGWLGLLSYYQSLRGLTLSDAVTIQFLSPNVVALLGLLFLHETMSRREIMAGFFCLAGVIFVSQPPFLFGGKGEEILFPDDGQGTRLDLPLSPGEGNQEGVDTSGRTISVIWAFVNILFASMAYTTIRWIGSKAHALHSIAYFSYLCTITSVFWLLIDPSPLIWPSSTFSLFLIFLIGVFGFLGQILLTMGLQREKAGRASLAMYLQVAFALVFEFFLWGTIPSFLGAMGTAVIITSAVWAAMGKTQNKPVKVTDAESLPFSRTPSPIPSYTVKKPKLRASGNYSYDSLSPSSYNEEGNKSTTSNSESEGAKSLLELEKSRLKSVSRRESQSSTVSIGGNGIETIGSASEIPSGHRSWTVASEGA
nr:hypothetical protein L204_02817 [Cryptococcus depauperatus CBS 7855]